MSIESRSISEQPKKQDKKPFSRTGRIVRFGLAGLALSPIIIGCTPAPATGTPEPVRAPEPILKYAPTPTPKSIPTPEPTTIPTPEPSYYQNNIVLNKEGLPVGYVLADGTKGAFNIDEVKQMRQAAIDSREPQILAIFPYERSKYSDFSYPTKKSIEFSKEHPVLSELPQDVLSDEELAAYGIKIIQADDTNLHLRRQAFEEGGPFAELASGHGLEKLTIVLVNGPVVTRDLLQDKKYDEVRHYLPYSRINVVEYRKEKIKEFQGQLGSLRNKIADAKSMADINPSQYEMLNLKGLIYAYETGVVTDEQLLEREWSYSSNEVGLYISGDKQHALGVVGDRYLDRAIFVVVGQDAVGSEKQIVYFDPNGKLLLDTLYVGGSRSMRPNANQSYPDPINFYRNPKASPDNPGSYPYGAQKPGQAFRHEVAHDTLIAQAVNKALKPNYGEYPADEMAMQGIRDAWNKLKNSGFTDNSGFWVVLSLPDGTYILTKKNKDKDGKSLRRKHLRERRLSRVLDQG